MLARLLHVVLIAILVGGCAPASPRGGFDSDNPASKLYAIRRAGAQRDRAKLPRLVEQLDSDDPAVRMLTIQALERITDTRLGYNPYASPQDRQQAIRRWVGAVRSGDFETDAATARSD